MCATNGNKEQRIPRPHVRTVEGCTDPATLASNDCCLLYTSKNLAAHSGFLQGWLLGWFETSKAGILALSNKGASNLASLGFVCFLVGRFTGAGLLKKYSAHKMLGLYLSLIHIFLGASFRGACEELGLFAGMQVSR